MGARPSPSKRADLGVGARWWRCSPANRSCCGRLTTRGGTRPSTAVPPPCARTPSGSSSSTFPSAVTPSSSNTACTPTSSRVSRSHSSPRSRGRRLRSGTASADMTDRRFPRILIDVGAVPLVLVTVAAVGFALTVWTGFPKGTDAYSHLTRLRFVADFFPRYEWLYSWSAGMPTFETYPELPYLLAAPVTKLFGAPVALILIAFLGFAL